jgi:hypothetical protein
MAGYAILLSLIFILVDNIEIGIFAASAVSQCDVGDHSQCTQSG